MINRNKSLEVTIDGTEVSQDMATFTRDPFSGSLSVGDEIILKFTKPISSIFVYLPTANSSATELTLAASGIDGTITIDGLIDDTKGFSRSGFIKWDPIDGNETSPEISGDFEYIYTLTFDEDLTDIVIGGINILFCDKNDLFNEFPNLNQLLRLDDDNTYDDRLIRLLSGARDDIETQLKNSKLYKLDQLYNYYPAEIDRWDLLLVEELRMVAVYQVLGKMFFDLSDTVGDIYENKATYYLAKADTLLQSTKISYDYDDDGALNVLAGERNYTNPDITFQR